MSEKSLESLVERRRKSGAGRLDECWEGIWHLTDPTARHQRIAGKIYRIHSEVIEDSGRGTVWISINVTDREEGWMENHRCPDGAVILSSNGGRWILDQVAFLGGPELVLEVLSEEDPRAKFSFYESLRVREVLIIDQEDGRPELWRLEEGGYREVSAPARSEVTGLEYLASREGLEARDPASSRVWKV